MNILAAFLPTFFEKRARVYNFYMRDFDHEEWVASERRKKTQLKNIPTPKPEKKRRKKPEDPDDDALLIRAYSTGG